MTPKQLYTILIESAELKQENARLRLAAAERDAVVAIARFAADTAQRERDHMVGLADELRAEVVELRKIEDLARAMIERLGVDGVSS